VLAALACCAPAQATFTPFGLVSASPVQGLEADYAYDPAISADGRYVAFTGSVASTPGVYRKDIATGALEMVAAGEDAGAPSISADGRYVSFTSDENPVTGKPDAGEVCSSVWVRDMDVQAGAAAFTLASALSGTPTEPPKSLTYSPLPGGHGCGAAAAGRVALSADGRRVAFTVLSPSDLTGPCEFDSETDETNCPTPPFQVAVRDLDSDTTTLVSSTMASQSAGTPQPVPRGAALVGPTSTGVSSLPGGGQAQFALGASTAAISADGGTVAWMGIDVAEQAPLAKPPPLFLNYPESYAEPLWRRIGDGPGAPTRRVLAGDDASAPLCPPACPGGLDLEWDTQGISGNEYTGTAPVYGSYTAKAGSANGFGAGAGLRSPLAAVTPQLSADGMEVALLSTQPNFGEDPDFGQLTATVPPPANAFVVNMAPGLTRAQAIERLTDWASLDFTNRELASPISGIALSGDGSRVLLATERIAFPLAPPALITPTLSQAGVTQLYEVNLLGGTLAMVSFGYDGNPANGEVFGAALNGDGRTLALASGATNLVYGVVNQGSDIYVSEEVHSPTAPGQQSITPLRATASAAIPWSLSVTATPSPDGTLVLYASVPGAGRLSASAVSAVSGTGGHPRKALKHRVARRAAAARRKAGRRRHAGAGSRIASASARAMGAAVLELHLIPAARYDSLLRHSRHGLYTTITVTFSAPGHRPLRKVLRVSFPHRPAIYNIPRPGYPLPKHAKRATKHRGGRR
jgi:WD40-like Beta Propeller Repeat